MRSDHRSPVHTLIVHEVDADDNRIDYTIDHPPTCKKEIHHGGMFDAVEYGSYEVWPDCGVEHVLDGIGIDEMFRDHLEREPAVGELRIVAVATYDDYTRESDLWIEEVPE